MRSGTLQLETARVEKGAINEVAACFDMASNAS